MTAEKKSAEGEGTGSKAVIGVIVAVVIVVVAFVVLSGKKSYEPVVAGADSIDFTLPDLNGKAHSLKDYRGKVVFLNFWASWCKPCEEEMPSMQTLSDALKGQPFEIVAVSIDKGDPKPVAEFVKKYGLTFTVLHDAKGVIKEKYKTTGVPETFIIDQNGAIAEKVWGPRDWTLQSSVTVILDLLKTGPKAKEAYKTSKSR